MVFGGDRRVLVFIRSLSARQRRCQSDGANAREIVGEQTGVTRPTRFRPVSSSPRWSLQWQAVLGFLALGQFCGGGLKEESSSRRKQRSSKKRDRNRGGQRRRAAVEESGLVLLVVAAAVQGLRGVLRWCWRRRNQPLGGSREGHCSVPLCSL